MTITGINEELLYIGIGITLQFFYHIVDAALGDVFTECHSGMSLESFAHIGTVGEKILGKICHVYVGIAPAFIVGKT